MCRGRTLVSVCMCCSFVSAVWPVAMRSALFCIVWSFMVCFCEIVGDQIVLAYSSIGLVMALYVCVIVSLLFPHVVDVSALSIGSVLRAFVMVFLMCVLYVCLGSKVSPRIFGF